MSAAFCSALPSNFRDLLLQPPPIPIALAMSTNLVKAHIYNTEGNWGTSKFNAATLTARITSIHFCAHSNEENAGSDGQTPANHWTFFLEIDPNSSVRVDAAPSGPYEPGMLILETNVTTSNVHEVATELPTGITVADVLQVLIAKKRDRYVFAAIGEGCRHWLSVVVGDFEEAGLVSPGFVKDVRFALSQYWRYPSGGSEPREIVQGTFF
ncbi:hypothetical protein FPV67DRAFT_513323 [Lyophyllum atratum]|nr:hypothetical protein FPV67DRAFT_513323 [Lyophyllum atratum]